MTMTWGVTSGAGRRTGKRAFDVCVSIVGLILLSPLFAGIAIAIRYTSPGPVLFRQLRIGLCGRPFMILKFRTMVARAPSLGPNVSPADDPRVTRIGAFLRRRYLDEIPQLLNVIRGDMSVVGPRPETPEFVALYTPRERRVLEMRPGMAGPSTLAFESEAQVLAATDDPYRHYVDHLLHERVGADLEYVDRQSFLYDLHVIVKSVLMVLKEQE
jgi:lipopolysaccharide/colanic/teichoic acid biosynthesis glycosyltransferase